MLHIAACTAPARLLYALRLLLTALATVGATTIGARWLTGAAMAAAAGRGTGRGEGEAEGEGEGEGEGEREGEGRGTATGGSIATAMGRGEGTVLLLSVGPVSLRRLATLRLLPALLPALSALPGARGDPLGCALATRGDFALPSPSCAGNARGEDGFVRRGAERASAPSSGVPAARGDGGTPVGRCGRARPSPTPCDEAAPGVLCGSCEGGCTSTTTALALRALVFRFGEPAGRRAADEGVAELPAESLPEARGGSCFALAGERGDDFKSSILRSPLRWRPPPSAVSLTAVGTVATRASSLRGVADGVSGGSRCWLSSLDFFPK